MRDLIERQAAIDIASGYCHPANIAKELAKLPSAQPERKHGRWIDNEQHIGNSVCSACGKDAPFLYDEESEEFCEWLPPFCLHCGAKMEEGGQG